MKTDSKEREHEQLEERKKEKEEEEKKTKLRKAGHIVGWGITKGMKNGGERKDAD